jgi:transposase
MNAARTNLKAPKYCRFPFASKFHICPCPYSGPARRVRVPVATRCARMADEIPCYCTSAMTSAEPARTTAYSPDIGWRVVIGMGLTFKDIATRLQIGVGTAHRLYARYVDTGDVAPHTQPELQNKRKLDNLHELCIIGLIHMRIQPSICMTSDSVLKSLRQRVPIVSVSGSTVCKVLHKNGLTQRS